MAAEETAGDVQAMSDAARHVNNAGHALATIRGNIQAAVDATAGGYNSPGARLFREVMAQWHDDFAKIISGLEKIETALTHNQSHYVATLDDEMHSAGTIAAILNGDTV
jgi:WXG100 family type VII secretion target